MSVAATALQPLESVADDLVASCRTVARQGYRLLVLLREFDIRRGYREARGKGRCAADSAEWLAARCGMGRDVVRDKLRVAYALLNLPETESAFEAGELTFTKVRALTEVATLDNEAVLIDFARAMTDAQVVDYCRRLLVRPAHVGCERRRDRS
ncbi:MAG: hypothetical protein OXK76_07890 [Gammaproteobacteria bacterium]|nr:hypothetical protein [Gammaproteobacteria bacterium]